MMAKIVPSFSSFAVFFLRYKYKTSDAFIGYHGDTVASLVFQVCHEMKETEGNDEWKDMVRTKM